jgi:hypothetical protein
MYAACSSDLVVQQVVVLQTHQPLMTTIPAAAAAAAAAATCQHPGSGTTPSIQNMLNILNNKQKLACLHIMITLVPDVCAKLPWPCP